MRHKLFFLGAPVLALALSMSAQTADPDPGALSLKKIQFSGLIDAYASKSFQNPATGTATGTLPGRAFDTDTDTFLLNMAKVEIQHAAEPVGFRLDLGFGRGFEIFNTLEPGGSALQYVPQAYVSFAPASWKGVQIDFGILHQRGR